MLLSVVLCVHVTATVTVTEALLLCPLLEDHERITVNRYPRARKQNQTATSQSIAAQFHLHRPECLKTAHHRTSHRTSPHITAHHKFIGITVPHITLTGPHITLYRARTVPHITLRGPHITLYRPTNSRIVCVHNCSLQCIVSACHTTHHTWQETQTVSSDIF